MHIKPIKKPDFFIVGAPRCGTTAMINYLGQHPEIYTPKEKESHHFATDLIPFDDHFRSRENYLKLFNDKKDEKLIGEASVFYLYSKEAAQNLYEFNKNAKIIIMIRNPVDMIYSYYSKLVSNGDENILDFKSALEAEEKRKRGIFIPKNIRFKERLYYSEVVRFSEQIERYFNIFDKDSVHYVIYDNFKYDTKNEYKKTLEFLNVNPHFQPEFKIFNQNMRIRSNALRDFFKNPPPWAYLFGKLVPPYMLKFIHNKLDRINIKYVKRKPMDPELRKTLRKQFLPEVQRVSILLGRDLSCW